MIIHGAKINLKMLQGRNVFRHSIVSAVAVLGLPVLGASGVAMVLGRGP